MKKSKRILNNRLAVFERDGWHCQYCGTSLTGHAEATVDHVVPVSLGGSGDYDNLRTACKPCNSTKKDRSAEWLRMFFAFNKTQYAKAITLAQYHQLLGMGVVLDALPVAPFFYERG